MTSWKWQHKEWTISELTSSCVLAGWLIVPFQNILAISHLSIWLCNSYTGCWSLTQVKYLAHICSRLLPVPIYSMATAYMYIFIHSLCVTAAALRQSLCWVELLQGSQPALLPARRHAYSAAIHLTSGLTSSYPCKYVQGQESAGGKDTVFLHLRFLNWHTKLQEWWQELTALSC